MKLSPGTMPLLFREDILFLSSSLTTGFDNLLPPVPSSFAMFPEPLGGDVTVKYTLVDKDTKEE